MPRVPRMWRIGIECKMQQIWEVFYQCSNAHVCFGRILHKVWDIGTKYATYWYHFLRAVRNWYQFFTVWNLRLNIAHTNDPWGSKGENIFSESGHFECQIQGNEAYDNIQSNILPLHIPTTPRMGSKGQSSFFRRWSCCISN